MLMEIEVELAVENLHHESSNLPDLRQLLLL
jgi:hypothetical protein